MIGACAISMRDIFEGFLAVSRSVSLGILPLRVVEHSPPSTPLQLTQMLCQVAQNRARLVVGSAR
jgi:hypothetical protein